MRGKTPLKGYDVKTFLFALNGHRFHLPGTRIYEEDGDLIYECPHCGTHGIPRHKANWVKTLIAFEKEPRVKRC